MNSIQKSTPYELLCIQERCFNLLEQPEIDALSDAYRTTQALLDAVNIELIARGRCTCCGLQHNVIECPRRVIQ